MRASIALATLATLIAGSIAAPLESRDFLNAITCDGQGITGTLVVRNPDQSTHVASFIRGDSDSEGRIKLTTKYNGTPNPSNSKFVFQVCTSAAYIYGRREEQTLTGFLTPYFHQNKAVTVGNQTSSGGQKYEPTYSLVSDVQASDKFTDTTLRQWFHLYNNGSFYSLAYTGREGGNTAGFAYGPVSRKAGDSIFVEMKYQSDGQLNYDGFVNPFGYALELHP
ncbi:hypothetical protein A4X13_0g4380 [Tilletia indica]|uniref:Uncharacterized protein n=1 Tax=Tilletia indica TaxID=43049 RepID=A0A177T8V8_9BASI|nr:hypothetical protein A4X13_0g4380 [Tilletia indica]